MSISEQYKAKWKEKLSFLSIHFIPFLICSWCVAPYVFQPYPANGIAALIIVALVVNAFRKPEYGVIAAIFLAPLTLSLGRHLQVYLKESAPPYLPYGEIILLATLLGLILRAICTDYKPQRFSVAQKERTSIETLLLWVMGIWVTLAVLGVFPALYRNLATSPSLPIELLAVKLAFAPVWGQTDAFFPITVAIRTILAFCFIYYIQLLIDQKAIYSKALKGFTLAILITAIYAVLQFAFEIGFSRGRVSNYIQSTFHENEGFATFNLLGFVIAFPFFFLNNNIWKKFFLGISSLFFLTAIALSNSRAIMLLAILALVIYPIVVLLRDRSFFFEKRARFSAFFSQYQYLSQQLRFFHDYLPQA
jgi:hypothetical protein